MAEKMIKKMVGFFFGICFLVAAGLAFVTYVLEIDVFAQVKNWWPALLIFVGFLFLFKRGSRMFGLWVMLFFGLWLCNNMDLIQVNTWQSAVIVTLICVGLSIIGGVFGLKSHYVPTIHNHRRDSYSSTASPGFLDASAVFGERNVNFNGQEFSGANVSAVFGSVTLDLRQATVPADCSIEIDTVFGGVEILIPPGVKIAVNGTPIFGGVENNAPVPVESAVTITINANAVFGGIEIK